MSLPEYQVLIGGEWRTPAATYEVRDPYRNTVVAHAPHSTLTDLNDALDAAEHCCESARLVVDAAQ